MSNSFKLNEKIKVFRISTVPISLNVLLRGQLEFLNSYFEIVAISSPGSDLTEVSQRENIRTYSIKMKRKIAILSDINSLVKLIVLFYREKPFIVHSITPKAGFLSMMAAFLVGVPIRIHTFTGLIFPTEKGFKKFLLKNIDRLTCFFATNIYPEGNGVKTDLIVNKITTKSLDVLANGNVNGIDSNYFNPDLFKKERIYNLKRDLNISFDSFVFIFVGRLVTDKGINELIESFVKFNLSIKSNLILVGDYEHKEDPLKSTTLEIIKSSPDIISLGYKKDIRPFLAIADCFIFPSYREGFPNVVLQAGAMGLPCIVTDINGSNEIIFDGVNGLVIPPKNVDEIFNKMKFLYENKSILNKLRDNARSMIISKFQQEYVWQSILNEYNKYKNSYFSN